MNEQLNQKRIQKIDCDLVIQIADKKFLAHREVLTKRLRFFSRKISTEMLKEKQTVIVLEPSNVDLEVFEDVLQYIYISQIKFTTANLESIYRTADYLRFDDLIDEAEKAMMNVDKTEKMIVIVMNVAKNYNLTSIESECKQSLITNPLSEVGKKYLIPALTFAHLKVLLKQINERKEDMFHLCVEWVRTDYYSRNKSLTDLLQLIPLEQLSTEFLNETVFNNPVVRNNSEALVLLIQALKSSKSKTSMNSDTSRPQTSNEFGKTSTSRTFDDSKNFQDSKNHSFKSSVSECLYVIGGYDGKDCILSSVSKLDSRTNKWTASTRMPCPRVQFGCAVIGRKIYVCGGYNRERNMNELTVYDTVTEQWTQLRPMKYARWGCAMAALDGFLYVASVWNGNERFSLIERYSVENNEWETVTPMTTERNALELVSMNGFLYAIGGRDKSYCGLKSVERYSPQTNEWTAVASLNNKYSWFGSAVLNNRIYVTGGFNCEVYHPEEDKWHTMPASTTSDSGLRLAVFNGKLLSVGGSDYPKGSKRVERYDFEAKTWVPEPDMDVARSHHGVAVVKDY